MTMLKKKGNAKVKVIFENEKLKEAYEKLSEIDPLKKKIDSVIERIRARCW